MEYNKIPESVNILDEKTTYIDPKATIEENVTIYPNNFIEGASVIESGVTLYPNNHIISSHIKSGASVSNSVIEYSVVGSNSSVGPFAHLRPQSEVGNKVKIGNFVELKKSKVGDGTKVSHLTYVGDAEIGRNVNIGCGVVFVNYNGKTKSKTTVGDNSFVGSSVNLIAPVKVGSKAFVCAGTTVDKDVADGDFVIGRSKMCIKQGRAKNYLKEE